MILFFLILFVSPIYGQKDSVDLYEHANAVIEQYTSSLEVHSKKKATQHIRKEILVLSEKGKDMSSPVIFYDQFIQVTHLSCTVSSIGGKVIEKYRSNDFQDASTTSGGTVYDDNRVKYLEIVQSAYPYKVIVEYDLEYNGLFQYPSWYPQTHYNLAVLESSFKVTFPDEVGLRYKATFADSIPMIDKVDGRTTYAWALTDLAAKESEVLSPPSGQVFPIVYLSPGHFEYDGFEGSMESWETFGQWLYTLLETRSTLTSDQIVEVRSVVEGLDDDRAKVKALYKFLQSTTRYVSIQLGIGGFQPIAASDVAELGYGDCKALSNYMRVMLQQVDIPSYYTVIGAGKSYRSFEYVDFPNAFQANHVILAVPIESDTMWLECTSQSKPCDFLGSFTQNRNALMVSEQGGTIIRTPSYENEASRRHTIGSYQLSTEGVLTGVATTHFKALAYEEVSAQLKASTQDRKDFLQEQIDITGLVISNIDYVKHEDRPEIDQTMEFEISDFCTVSGARRFMSANVTNRMTWIPPLDKDREVDIVISTPAYEIDSVAFDVGAWQLESIPDPINLETAFGTYRNEIKQKDNILTYKRIFRLYKDQYPASNYKDFRGFLRKVVRADKAKLVLIST